MPARQPGSCSLRLPWKPLLGLTITPANSAATAQSRQTSPARSSKRTTTVNGSSPFALATVRFSCKASPAPGHRRRIQQTGSPMPRSPAGFGCGTGRAGHLAAACPRSDAKSTTRYAMPTVAQHGTAIWQRCANTIITPRTLAAGSSTKTRPATSPGPAHADGPTTSHPTHLKLGEAEEP